MGVLDLSSCVVGRACGVDDDVRHVVECCVVAFCFLCNTTLHQMDSEASLNKHNFYVKLDGGRRIAVTISTQADGEIVSIVNSRALEIFSNAKPPAALSIPTNQVAGIRRVVNEDGSVTPIPSEKVKTDIRLFVDSAQCWFPECEALRAAYNAELASLPTGCPDCERGALIRK